MIKWRESRSLMSPTSGAVLPAVPSTSPGQSYGPPRVSKSERFFKPWFLRGAKTSDFLHEVMGPQMELISQGSLSRPSWPRLGAYIEAKKEKLRAGRPALPKRGFVKRSKLNNIKRLQLIPSEEHPFRAETDIPSYMEPPSIAELPIAHGYGTMETWKGRDENGMMVSGLSGSKAKYVAPIAIATLVGLSLWNDYKKKAAAKEALERKHATLVKQAEAAETEKRRQEAMGKAIQLQAQLEYQRRVVRNAEARVITEAANKGVSIDPKELRKEAKAGVANISLMIMGAIGIGILGFMTQQRGK